MQATTPGWCVPEYRLNPRAVCPARLTPKVAATPPLANWKSFSVGGLDTRDVYNGEVSGWAEPAAAYGAAGPAPE